MANPKFKPIYAVKSCDTFLKAAVPELGHVLSPKLQNAVTARKDSQR